MKVLPVAERELRTAARRSATYWVRFHAAGLGIGAAGVVLVAMLTEPTVQQSRALFRTLSFLAFGFCLLSGVLTTSASVSEEKRDGTLGLLFLTSLRGYDVVVGKFVANSLRAIMGLVALIPIIALPLLMGGIPVGLVWKMAIILLNTMFLSLAIGMFVSVLSRSAHSAMSGTILVLAVLMVVVPVARLLIIEYLIRPPPTPPGTSTYGLPEPFGWSLLLNPAVSFTGAMNPLSPGRPTLPYLWPSLMVQHALAWIALAGACVLVTRVWRDKARTRAVAGRRSPSAAGTRRSFLDEQPLAWLVVRQGRPAMVTWIGLAIIGLVWVWAFAELGDEWLQGVAGLWTLFIAALWLKLRMASVSCRNLHEQRRAGTLELVLCTPRGSESLVQGHLAGVRHLMTGPLTLVLTAGAVLMLAAIEQDRSGAAAEWLILFGAVMLVLFLDLRTLAWAGMWHGLRSSRYNRAYALTIARVLLLPWVLFIVTPILFSAVIHALDLPISFGSNPRVAVLIPVAWWVFLSVAIDVWVIASAQHGVTQTLRHLADGTPESPTAVVPPLIQPRTATHPVQA